MHRILCVEDGEETRDIIQASLRGQHLTFATTAEQASALLIQNRYSMVLIDIELPDGNGFEVIADSQDRLKNIPVIFLTSKIDFASKASAFSLGADDYIQKPFDPRELKLRVEAKLRKLEQADEADIELGPLILNLREQRIFHQDASVTPIDLTSLEFRIFHLLAKTPNRIFSRESILERVWGNSVSVSDRAVDVHVSNLRRKLAGTGVTIDTVIGSGYRVLIESKP